MFVWVCVCVRIERMHDHEGKVTSLSRLSAQVQPCHTEQATTRHDEKTRSWSWSWGSSSSSTHPVCSALVLLAYPVRTFARQHKCQTTQFLCVKFHGVGFPSSPWLASSLISSRLAWHRISSWLCACLACLPACILEFSLHLSPSHSVCLPPGHANKIAENPQPTKVLTNAFGLRWRRWHLSRFVRDSEAICARFAPKLIKRVESQFCSRRGVRQVSMEIKQKGLPNAISYLGAWQANLTEAAVAFELSNSRRMMSHWLESEPGNLSHYINSSSNNRKRV